MAHRISVAGRSARALGCAFAYVAAAVLSVAFTREAGTMAVFWPANALLLGLLLRMPPRDYPASLAACMLAAIAVNLGYSDPFLVAVTRAAVNILAVLCGYHLIARLSPTVPLSDLRTLFILWAASLAAPLVSATAGATLLESHGMSFAAQWWTRWSRDAVGMILLLPLIASLEPRPIKRLLSARPAWRRISQGAELAAAFGLMFGIFGLIIHGHGYGSPTLFAPVLLWIALRFGIFPTAAAAVTIDIVAVIAAAHDAWPPLFADATTSQEILSLQLFVLLVALPPLVVAVVVGERARARRQLDDALESMADAFALYDGDGRLILCNPRYPAFLSRIADLLVPGVRYEDLVREGARRGLWRDAPAAAEAESWIADQVASHRAGSASEVQLADGRWLQAIARPTADGGTVDVRRDITERKQLEEAVEHMAMHDALTNLPNRAMFYRELERALARAEREPCRIAVILVDLDRFKEVNDTFGHASGDRLLVEVGNRLVECVRTEDLVARLGGDEFAVIAVSREAPDGFAALARRIVERLSERLRVGGIQIEPGASLGMTVFPDDPGSLNELMVHADRALYAAKQTGRGTWRQFADRMAEAGQSPRARVKISAAP